MNPNHDQNRQHKTIVDLLKKPFTKKMRSPRKENLRFDDSSRIHKPYKDLPNNLLPSKKRERIEDDDDRLLRIKKPAFKEGKKIDDHKPSKGLSGNKRMIEEIPNLIKKPAFKEEKKIDDHKPSMSLSGNKRKIQEIPNLIKKSAFKEENKKKKGLSRDMQPQQHGVSTKIKIQDNHNSQKPPRNVDIDALSRRTRVETTPGRRLVKKLQTKDAAECKHNESVGALISKEEYLKNSTEKISLQGEADDDWWCKPLSEFVIPGPIPDLDALNCGPNNALNFSNFFLDDED